MADAIVTRLNEHAPLAQVLKHPALRVRAVKAAKDRPTARGDAHLSAVPQPRPGVYCYPTSMLHQERLCRGGDGTWHAPSMTMYMLGDERFVSPLGALLDQLEAEGHDVSGARAEWLAFREHARAQQDDYVELMRQVTLISGRRPAEAAKLIAKGEGGYHG